MYMFKDKQEILALIERADNFDNTRRLTEKFAELRLQRQEFYLTAEDLDDVLRWKLRSQFGRQKNKRSLNTNENIIKITKAAFGVSHHDKDFETCLRVKILSTITGVEVPVASAILTLCYPEQYCVLDFRNWRQVYADKKMKSKFSVSEYTAYLNLIKKKAEVFDVTAQQFDIAVWQHDIENDRDANPDLITHNMAFALRRLEG
jgi:thermostable 8-oxoguanine DNA glycosylase